MLSSFHRVKALLFVGLALALIACQSTTDSNATHPTSSAESTQSNLGDAPHRADVDEEIAMLRRRSSHFIARHRAGLSRLGGQQTLREKSDLLGTLMLEAGELTLDGAADCGVLLQVRHTDFGPFIPVFDDISILDRVQLSDTRECIVPFSDVIEKVQIQTSLLHFGTRLRFGGVKDGAAWIDNDRFVAVDWSYRVQPPRQEAAFRHLDSGNYGALKALAKEQYDEWTQIIDDHPLMLRKALMAEQGVQVEPYKREMDQLDGQGPYGNKGGLNALHRDMIVLGDGTKTPTSDGRVYFTYQHIGFIILAEVLDENYQRIPMPIDEDGRMGDWNDVPQARNGYIRFYRVSHALDIDSTNIDNIKRRAESSTRNVRPIVSSELWLGRNGVLTMLNTKDRSNYIFDGPLVQALIGRSVDEDWVDFSWELFEEDPDADE